MNVSLKHIFKTYSKSVALQDITYNFSLRKVIGIIGAIGLGKHPSSCEKEYHVIILDDFLKIKNQRKR